MRFVQKSDIPEYLKQGELFRSLVENESDHDELLSFPANALKPDVIVRCVEDCEQFLNSCRFWGVPDYLTVEIVDFVLSAQGDACSDVLEKYEEELRYLRPLRLMAAVQVDDRMEIAIASGEVELAKGAARKSNFYPLNACELAARAGSLEMLKYLRKCGCIAISTAISAAAKHGHIHIIQYLRAPRCVIWMDNLQAAAEGGQLECVRYVFPILKSHTAEKILIRTASHRGNMDLLYYLDTCNIDWSQHSCLPAAEAGNFECLMFLHEHGCSWDAHVTAHAAAQGRLDHLTYMHEHGCPWDCHTCYNAQLGGHIDCLQYAHEHGCERGFTFQLKDDNPCKAYLALHRRNWPRSRH